MNDKIRILLVEDDEDDYLLTLEAFKEAGVSSEILWFKDGEELMIYLGNGSSGNEERSTLIILDLNMPKKDGREVLTEIKGHPELRKIPVIILTTSKAQTDIVKSYDLGVNSFIQKPMRFQQFVEIAKTFSQYWLNTVKLPV